MKANTITSDRTEGSERGNKCCCQNSYYRLTCKLNWVLTVQNPGIFESTEQSKTQVSLIQDQLGFDRPNRRLVRGLEMFDLEMDQQRHSVKWRRARLVAGLVVLFGHASGLTDARVLTSFVSNAAGCATSLINPINSCVDSWVQTSRRNLPRRRQRAYGLSAFRSISELHGSKKDWDAILAEEEQGDTPSRKSKIPYDMRYNQRNCERSSKNFVAIKEAGGPGADIYCCEESKNDDEGVFWFLGKVAHISDVSLEAGVARLWPLIQQHAANLRPLDLFGAVTNEQLELWCAPLDSEFDVAYNRPHCVFQKMSADVPNAETINVNYVGFQGEVYERGEEGFRARRFRSTGLPSRPEITGPAEEVNEEPKAPSDDEMAQLEKALEGKDINALYEEQERRRQDED
jgi:hypothetical protein